jgi:hypothetical protein
MPRAQPQRFEIEGDRLLRHPGLQMHVAEIAPAGDETRRKPQRGPVVLRRGVEIVAEHEGIGERGVKIGRDVHSRTDRYRGHECEPGLEDRDCVLEITALVVLAARAQQVGGARSARSRRRESE